MRICLTNLPWEDRDRWGIRAGCRFPNLMPRQHNSYVPFPFLLAYTASFLESHGHEVLVLDGVAERCPLSQALQSIARFRPALVVAETSTASLSYDLRALQELHRLLPGVPIAAYGPHVSIRPADALGATGVDFVILGEPEVTCKELAGVVRAGGDILGIQGLAFRSPTGELQVNDRRPLIEDIDALPYPKRDTLPMSRYRVPGFPPTVAFMYASRGCPFQCSYCLWPQTIFERGRYRARDPEKIAEEMQWVLEHFPGTRSFFFDDDTFNIGRERLMRFAAALRQRRLSVPWGMNARGDGWDEEILRALAAVGLFTLRIGVESGDPAVLAGCHKALDLDALMRTLEWSTACGLRNHVSFMIGLEGETPASVERTIELAARLPVDSVQFSVAVPFPGTEFYDSLERQKLLLTRDFDRYNGADTAVMRTPTMSQSDIEQAIQHARRRVYFSPKFIWRRLRYIREPRDFLAIARKAMRLAVPNDNRA